MSKYKLMYFDLRARAEAIRWIFEQAAVKYEDARVKEEQWPSMKPDMPFGQLPVLEVDDERLVQSTAIGRYLANQFGLAGKSNWEKALADQYVAAADDMYNGVVAFYWEEDKDRKVVLRKKFVEEIAPAMLSKFEKFLSLNSSGFLVGDNLTWADLLFCVFMENFETRASPEFGVLLKDCPKIKAHSSKIRNLPRIAAWIQRRQDSIF